MGYFSVTASGAGVSGNTLPNSGIVSFAITTGLEWATVTPYLKAADGSGNLLAQAESPSDAGGDWSYQNNWGLPKTITVNMATFRSAFAVYDNLGGLLIKVFCNSSSGGLVDAETFYFPLAPLYTEAGAPISPNVSATISRDAVELSWGAGSDGTSNNVIGYDVQHCDSADGVSWGSWTTISGSPVTAAKISVTPPLTVGHYRKFRVRTRGSAGEEWYSEWVESVNVLRRKWDAFGAWTDPTLTAGVSGIRAVHLTQLQERVNTIRAFYGLGTYGFTVVTPRVTKIARWAALIGEIRAAIDTVAANHEAWNTLEAGKPRIAHIMQLRRVIDAL